VQGSGGLLTEYSFSVYKVQADCQLNIQLVCAGIRRITDQTIIWCMHRQMTNWIFINCARWIRIEYSIVGNHWNDWMGQVGIEYSIVRNHRIKIRIECLIVRMVVLWGLEYSIVGMIGVGRSELNI
jgi:hypothetical protein